VQEGTKAMNKFKKYSKRRRRKRLERVSRFSTPNIVFYIGSFMFVGYLIYLAVFQQTPYSEKDAAISLFILDISIIFSGFAIIRDKRTIDFARLRVLRGKEAVIAGVKLIIGGIFMVLVMLFKIK
jgi:uncharacterized membrane protein YidH (DUF202 family)